jgi:hypothetical protein
VSPARRRLGGGAFVVMTDPRRASNTKRKRLVPSWRNYYEARPIPSPEQVEDRDRRRYCEIDANMAVLGDPLPGRSALDQKDQG